MVMRFENLIYTDEELEKDAIHYLEEAVYEPSYAQKVKDFIASDMADFKRSYDCPEYLFLNIFYDEYQNGYVNINDKKVPNTDFRHLTEYLDKSLSNIDITEDDVERYVQLLDSEFKKNALCTHMEPYFVEEDAVVATVMAGYSKNPMFSICSLAREWCMSMHLKYMYPKQVRKYGYQFQCIQKDFSGEERLKQMIDFRDKYHSIFKNIGVMRAIHSNVFAYAYLFLKATLTNETKIAEEFILDSSASKIPLLFQGESIKNFDFPVTKYVLEQFKTGKYKEFLREDGRIKWGELYKFTFDAIKDSGLDGVRIMGFDSIEAKTLQSFWNKSSNMQSMLKILRRLALENNNPVFNQLIEGCEYHLGRPDKNKDKMEQFIDDTRKLMNARSYELTKPRLMAQELVAAFPSVFLVYFQWHHNFRTIYPKVPKTKVNQDLQLQKTLKDALTLQVIKNNDEQKTKILQNQELKNLSLANALREQTKNRELEIEKYKNQQNVQIKQINDDYQNKLRSIMMNKERTMTQMSMEKSINQRQNATVNTNMSLSELMQRQNSY